MVAGIATFDAWCSASMTSTAPPPALPAPGITLARLRKTPLVVATHNAGKVGELLTLLAPLGVTGVGAASLGLHEPDETEETFTGNALLKASLAAAQTGRVALADDSGVCVDALGGAPGIYTARWAGERTAAGREARSGTPTVVRTPASASRRMMSPSRT